MTQHSRMTIEEVREACTRGRTAHRVAEALLRDPAFLKLLREPAEREQGPQQG